MMRLFCNLPLFPSFLCIFIEIMAVVRLVVLFRKGLWQGYEERWEGGVLFRLTFRELLNVIASPSSYPVAQIAQQLIGSSDSLLKAAMFL